MIINFGITGQNCRLTNHCLIWLYKLSNSSAFCFNVPLQLNLFVPMFSSSSSSFDSSKIMNFSIGKINAKANQNRALCPCVPPKIPNSSHLRPVLTGNFIIIIFLRSLSDCHLKNIDGGWNRMARVWEIRIQSLKLMLRIQYPTQTIARISWNNERDNNFSLSFNVPEKLNGSLKKIFSD